MLELFLQCSRVPGTPNSGPKRSRKIDVSRRHSSRQCLVNICASFWGGNSDVSTRILGNSDFVLTWFLLPDLLNPLAFSG